MGVLKIIADEHILKTVRKERSFLDRSEFTSFPVRSNEEALAIHRKEKANLIVAKLDSPEMSGEKLCSLIRDDRELRKVSLIIVCNSQSDFERCMACRANAFLANPIHPAVLLQEMHRLLNIAARGSCRVPIAVAIQGTRKETPFTGFLDNISTTGMLFRSDAVLYEGDTVTCTFSLPGSSKVAAEAEIVRLVEVVSETARNLYGLSFTDPDSRLISAIEKFVASHRDCL